MVYAGWGERRALTTSSRDPLEGAKITSTSKLPMSDATTLSSTASLLPPLDAPASGEYLCPCQWIDDFHDTTATRHSQAAPDLVALLVLASRTPIPFGAVRACAWCRGTGKRGDKVCAVCKSIGYKVMHDEYVCQHDCECKRYTTTIVCAECAQGRCIRVLGSLKHKTV